MRSNALVFAYKLGDWTGRKLQTQTVHSLIRYMPSRMPLLASRTGITEMPASRKCLTRTPGPASRRYTTARVARLRDGKATLLRSRHRPRVPSA